MARKVNNVNGATYEQDESGAWFLTAGKTIFQIARDAGVEVYKRTKDNAQAQAAARAAVKAHSQAVRDGESKL